MRTIVLFVCGQIANRDFKKGEVIYAEEPFASVLNFNRVRMFCEVLVVPNDNCIDFCVYVRSLLDGLMLYAVS